MNKISLKIFIKYWKNKEINLDTKIFKMNHTHHTIKTTKTHQEHTKSTNKKKVKMNKNLNPI